MQQAVKYQITFIPWNSKFIVGYFYGRSSHMDSQRGREDISAYHEPKWTHVENSLTRLLARHLPGHEFNFGIDVLHLHVIY